MSGKKLLPSTIKTLRSAQQKAERELFLHRMAHYDEVYEPGVGYYAVNTDPDGENAIKEKIARLKMQADDLEQNGREPRSEVRAGHVKHARTPFFEREKVIGHRVVWSRSGRRKLDREFNEEGENHYLTKELGVRNRQELEELLNGPYGKQLAKQHYLSTYGVQFVKETRKETVANTNRVVPEHKVRHQGYPDDKARRRLRENMHSRLYERRFEWITKEVPKAEARLAGAKEAAAKLSRRPLQALTVLRNPKVRIGALAAGALLGGWSGWKIHDAVEKLAKADNDREIPGSASELHRAGTEAEASMAERLARVLGDVKDDAAGELLSPRKGSLMSTFITGLDHAMKPLDSASRGGIQAPIPGEVQQEDGTPKTVNFTLAARSPRVEKYIQDYRKSRITALVKDQQEAIKALLIRYAREGLSPDQLARLVGKTIGLTPDQAQHVMNYQQELEDLRPNALNRELRDKRFDKTVQRAIDENRPLTAEQIQKMVDAYHRKYLAYRAMTIARTEGVGAANNGHVAAIEDLLDRYPGYTVVKTWIATEDERTRPDHVGLHGQSVIGLHTPFVAPSGDTIKWPHDPDGAARQLVNCRCTLATKLVPRTLAARLGTASVSQPEETEDA